MLIRFLGAVGKVYSLSSAPGPGGGAGGAASRYVLEYDPAPLRAAIDSNFESIKRQVLKIVSEVNHQLHLYSIYGAWYDLLSATLAFRPEEKDVYQARLNQASLEVLLQLVGAEAVFEQEKGDSDDFVHPDFLAHLERWADELRVSANLPEKDNQQVHNVAHDSGNGDLRKYCVNDDGTWRDLRLLGTNQDPQVATPYAPHPASYTLNPASYNLHPAYPTPDTIHLHPTPDPDNGACRNPKMPT